MTNRLTFILGCILLAAALACCGRWQEAHGQAWMGCSAYLTNDAAWAFGALDSMNPKWVRITVDQYPVTVSDWGSLDAEVSASSSNNRQIILCDRTDLHVPNVGTINLILNEYSNLIFAVEPCNEPPTETQCTNAITAWAVAISGRSWQPHILAPSGQNTTSSTFQISWYPTW